MMKTPKAPTEDEMKANPAKDAWACACWLLPANDQPKVCSKASQWTQWTPFPVAFGRSPISAKSPVKSPPKPGGPSRARRSLYYVSQEADAMHRRGPNQMQDTISGDTTMTTSTTATKRADEDKQSVDVNPNTIKHLRQHGGGEDDDDGDGDGEKWSSRQEGVHASTIGNNNGEEPDAAAASSPTLELTRASGRFQSHPGAYAVAGPGGDGSGDDTTGFEEQSTSRQLEGGDMEDALEAEVHDEEAVRTRVHDRVEQRIRNQAVCATNVRTVVDNSGATDGIDIDNGKDDNLDNSGKNNNGLWERYKAPMMLFGLGALALLLVVVMVVFLSSSNKTYDDPPPLNEETTASNDEANEVSLSDEQYLVNILKTVSNETLLLLDDDFAGSTTPQYKAMRWLVDANDPSILDVQSVVDEQTIIERYSLAVLYFSTDGINSWDPITKDYFLSNATSVCEWNDGVDIGVFCNEERHVKEITMSK